MLNSLLEFWMLYKILRVNFNSAHFFSFWLSSLLWIPFWNSECYTKSFRWISILHISFLFGFQAFFEFPSEILNVIQNPSGEFQFCTFLFFLAFKPPLNSLLKFWMLYKILQVNFNSAHFFSFWLSSLLWIPFWNSECYTKSFRWISILHISFLFGFQASFEFPSEILTLTFHLTNYQSKTRHGSHCWRSKDELLRDVPFWTPTHGHTSVGWLTKMYISCVRTQDAT